MAIYHLSMKLFSRKDNRSSTKAAAYRSASKIEDERMSEIYDYTRKRGVIYTEIVMPASESIFWTPSRSELWNAVEMKNKREDSVVCREVEIALPMELTDGQRRELTQNFAHEIADKYGIGVDISIHKPDIGSKNYHAHLLITTNRIEGAGLGNKTRELDSIATRQVDKTSQNATEFLRQRWEELANGKLRAVGFDISIDRRTLEEQGLDREATQHEGKAVTAMERKKNNKIKTRIHAENERRMQEDQARREAVSDEWKRIEGGIDKKYAEAEVKAMEDIELRRFAYEAEEAARQKKLEEEAEAELKAKELEREREKIAEQTRKQQIAEPVNDLNDLGFGELVRNQWRDAGKKFVLKKIPIGGFEASTPPQPIKIYGYEAVPHNDGTIFYHPKGKSSEVAFVDRKTSLELYENSDKTIVEMLNLSAKKWPDGFYVRGDDEFRTRAEALAQKWGLADKVKNPLAPMSVSPTPAPKIEPTLPPIGEREQGIDVLGNIEKLNKKLTDKTVIDKDDWESCRVVLYSEKMKILGEICAEFDALSEQRVREAKIKSTYNEIQENKEFLRKSESDVSDRKERLSKLEHGFLTKIFSQKEIGKERIKLEALEKQHVELANKVQALEKQVVKQRAELANVTRIEPKHTLSWEKEWDDSVAVKTAERLAEYKYPMEAKIVKRYEEQERDRAEKAAAAERTAEEERQATEKKRIEEQERAVEEAKRRAKMEIVIEAKKHLGDVKIIDADTWEDYDGKIVAKNERYAVQQTKERAVCHDLRNNSSLKSFSVGDNVAISYDGSGRGETERFDAKKHDRGRGLGR